MVQTNLEWDYTDRAKTYDYRADYSTLALKRMIEGLGLSEGCLVADIGAGTAKLSYPLAAKFKLIVDAVEPNDAMRSYGINNTKSLQVTWFKGTGENTGLKSSFYDAALFGSSFNVVDQERALMEVARILKPSAGFACMWNHRNLNDPLQKDIEETIQRIIPQYTYGKRRQDPTLVIQKSGFFAPVVLVEETFSVEMRVDVCIAAWK